MKMLTTARAYERYQDGMKKLAKIPVSRKSFERYLRDGRLPSRKKGGRRLIKSAVLDGFINVKAMGTPTPKSKSKSSARAKSGDFGDARIDNLVWTEIKKQLMRELLNEEKTPRLVQQAIGMISNKKTKTLFIEYIGVLESEMLMTHGPACGHAHWWESDPDKGN